MLQERERIDSRTHTLHLRLDTGSILFLFKQEGAQIKPRPYLYVLAKDPGTGPLRLLYDKSLQWTSAP
jgi:hypothetical protein